MEHQILAAPAVLCPGIGDKQEREGERGEERGGEERGGEERGGEERGGEGRRGERREGKERSYQDTLEFHQERSHISTLLQPLKGRERERGEVREREKGKRGRRGEGKFKTVTNNHKMTT